MLDATAPTSALSWLPMLGLMAGLVLAAAVALWWWRGRTDSVAATPTRPAEATEDWHALDTDAVLLRVNSSEEGLKQSEAERRLAEHGPNKLPEAKPRSPLMRFLAQFHNVLIYVLIVAGVVTALLQHWLDAGVIFGVVLINAFIGFVQEGKAEDALKAIRGMLSPHARVWREGRLVTVDATELVPGDLVALQSGDKVPADLRLLRAKGVEIEEAALTGESVPVEKGTDPLGSRCGACRSALYGLFRHPGDAWAGRRHCGRDRYRHRDRTH